MSSPCDLPGREGIDCVKLRDVCWIMAPEVGTRPRALERESPWSPVAEVIRKVFLFSVYHFFGEHPEACGVWR